MICAINFNYLCSAFNQNVIYYFTMFRRNRNGNKAKLEHKLYLARENPEPVFDLADCELPEVPSGIYSLCRVFLKESLRLENNRLSSLSGGGSLKDLQLLKILNISNNSFQTIPDEICYLKNLEELFASNNQLKKLCNTICELSNLRILDLSDNALKILPDNLGCMVNLKKLDVRNNKKLTNLPKSIHKLHKLCSLLIDHENFTYPPANVLQQGIKETFNYICEDIGILYKHLEVHEQKEIEPELEAEDTCDSFQARIWELGNLKQQKMREFLEIEKNNEIQQKQEIELANASKINKEKLLAVLVQQQDQLDHDLNKIQLEKETERFRLVEQLQEEENNADIMIKQLLTLSYEPSGQLLEQEQQEEERLLAAVNRYNDTLRTDYILSAMQDILEQENAKFQEFHQNRLVTSQSILAQETEMDLKLVDVLQGQEKHKDELVNLLKIDNDLQKAAVATLLERGDARSWGLLQQIRMVEAQLAALTSFEIDRKKLQMDKHMNDLCDKRVSLSLLLMDLLDQQKERRSQLISTLQTMEDNNNDSLDDFWLKQYQRLLDKLPEGLSQAQKNIDPALAQSLLVNGVIHCLPFLAKLIQCQLDTRCITDSDLQTVGIACGSERRKILDAFYTYEKEKESCLDEPASPSAPPLEEPSAPRLEEIKAINTSECVICLDMECQIIFLPCGHMCCCRNCCASITECPLCRSDINRKITLVL